VNTQDKRTPGAAPSRRGDSDEVPAPQKEVNNNNNNNNNEHAYAGTTE
jgi:hypothetical protein